MDLVGAAHGGLQSGGGLSRALVAERPEMMSSRPAASSIRRSITTTVSPSRRQTSIPRPPTIGTAGGASGSSREYGTWSSPISVACLLPATEQPATDININAIVQPAFTLRSAAAQIKLHRGTISVMDRPGMWWRGWKRARMTTSPSRSSRRCSSLGSGRRSGALGARRLPTSSGSAGGWRSGPTKGWSESRTRR